MKRKHLSYLVILVVCLVTGMVANRFLGKGPVGAGAKQPPPSPSLEATGRVSGPMAQAAPDRGFTGTAVGEQATAEAATPIAADIPAPMNPDFRLRPFKVVKSTASHQWTGEDCLTGAAIHELAHNALEEERYLQENQWTTRRQLVYRNESAGDWIEALESGARQQIVVPGFDGHEFIVDIKSVERFDGEGFGLQGLVSGHPDSIFNLGYASPGRESMTVIIPSLGLRYEIMPRENNEVVINQIDASRMEAHAPPMSEPIRNDDVGAPQPSGR